MCFKYILGRMYLNEIIGQTLINSMIKFNLLKFYKDFYWIIHNNVVVEKYLFYSPWSVCASTIKIELK